MGVRERRRATASVGWCCLSVVSARSSAVSPTSVGLSHSGEPFSVRRKSVSPAELCPGSPGGSCPPLPRTRSVGLSEGQSPLRRLCWDRLTRASGTGLWPGGLTWAELTADAGTNQETLSLWPDPLELGDLSPFEERGCSQS